MTEIEIKAHVADPAMTEKIISSFAVFEKKTEKSDEYWTAGGISSDPKVRGAAISIGISMTAALTAAISIIAGADKFAAIGICATGMILSGIVTLVSGKKGKRSFNGGKEMKVRLREAKDSESGKKELFITYKKKEIQGEIEVNDEKEFSVDNRKDFEALLSDLGFTPSERKEKKTKSFRYTTKGKPEISIELSLLTGLGWFIELEILEENPDTATIEKDRAFLFETLDRCGIPRTAIETRYYTQMLAELKTN